MKRGPGKAKGTWLIVMALGIWLAMSCATQKAPLMPNEGTLSQWDATVEKHIPDAKRAANLKRLGRQLADLADAITNDIDTLNEKAKALNEKYDATAEEARQLVVEYTKMRNPAFEQYRNIIFAMRGEVSAEEWKALTE